MKVWSINDSQCKQSVIHAGTVWQAEPFMDHRPAVDLGLSENVVYPEKPNGFADHYPVSKWLFHWEDTLFSDKPI